MTTNSKPHPLNAPGRFYVEDGCCLTCAIPFIKTPDLFAWANDEDPRLRQCYVRKQPESADELARMRWTLKHQELDCIQDTGSPFGSTEER